MTAQPYGFAKFEQQLAYEHEGAAAGLAGKLREDCPYDRETQSTAWNFWVYGRDNAVHEKATIDRGFVVLTSTGANAFEHRIPVKEAIDSGMWKPRYVDITGKSS